MVKRWICSQIGAREHYAVPRACHSTGGLDALYTDFWPGPWLRSLRVGTMRSMAARCHPDLFQADVRSWNARAIGWELALRRQQRQGGSAGKYSGFMEVGRKFALAVRDDLGRRDLSNRLFFGYDTGSLETLEYLRNRGVPCIVSQMDPSRVEAEIVAAEERRWPGWSLDATAGPNAYFQRREQEWALADRIVVNSAFSRAALVQQGVPVAKIAIIPLAYDPIVSPSEPRPRGAPLRVLFLGQVILRKGIQYLLEAARGLPDMQFDIVGPLGISAKAVQSAPGNVKFHGRVSRDQAARWYEISDVFVLPTLSDGFALTQLEAMAHGLPVIATSNCGEVVTDGVDGSIVPSGKAEPLAEAIGAYRDPARLAAHRRGALAKSTQFTSDRLKANLIALESSLTGA